jgi:hypothetical protein
MSRAIFLLPNKEQFLWLKSCAENGMEAKLILRVRMQSNLFEQLPRQWL